MRAAEGGWGGLKTKLLTGFILVFNVKLKPPKYTFCFKPEAHFCFAKHKISSAR